MNRGKPQAPDVSVQQTVAPVVKEPVAPGDPTKPLTPVKDYMASAILVTIFCFLPTGLYAIFQAYAVSCNEGRLNMYTLFHEIFSTFFGNKISLPERRNKRKSVLEITKMYYF